MISRRPIDCWRQAAHFWGGLPVKEIAGIEEITTVAIRKRLHKAFGLIEAMLDEDEAR